MVNEVGGGCCQEKVVSQKLGEENVSVSCVRWYWDWPRREWELTTRFGMMEFVGDLNKSSFGEVVKPDYLKLRTEEEKGSESMQLTQ